jgi:hypothetical protein
MTLLVLVFDKRRSSSDAFSFASAPVVDAQMLKSATRFRAHSESLSSLEAEARAHLIRLFRQAKAAVYMVSCDDMPNFIAGPSVLDLGHRFGG